MVHLSALPLCTWRSGVLSVRALSTAGLNFLDQPHQCSLLTRPPPLGPGGPVKLRAGCSVPAELCCRCACLLPCFLDRPQACVVGGLFPRWTFRHALQLMASAVSVPISLCLSLDVAVLCLVWDCHWVVLPVPSCASPGCCLTLLNVLNSVFYCGKET